MRVLVAEDDPVSRMVLSEVLRQLGHEAVVATDGAQAWSIARDRDIDVIISDWVMPGLDGLELCRRVRARDGRYTYFILLTGRDDQREVLEALEAGADDHLAKPLDPLALQLRMVVAARVTELHRQLAVRHVQLGRLNAELALAASTDPLTGLGNRLQLTADSAELDAGMQRYGWPVSVAIFDVDHFKAYNDTYGHVAGDEVLRRVGATIAGQLRTGDRAYRYGGEEFLVAFPHQPPSAAWRAAERIRGAVDELAIVHCCDPGRVTVSAGVAEATAGDRTMEAAVRAADRCLYDAKAAGRNRVSSALDLRADA